MGTRTSVWSREWMQSWSMASGKSGSGIWFDRFGFLLLSRSPAVLAVVGRGCRPLYKARSLEDKGCAGRLPSVGCRSATLRTLPGHGRMCGERLKEEEVEKRKMPLSGEAIRMMNYVDDVATTMRRLLAVAPTLTNEERKRVSEYLRVSSPNAGEVLTALDKK